MTATMTRPTSPSRSAAYNERTIAFGFTQTDLVLLATAGVALWNTAHEPLMLLFMVPLMLLAILPGTRTNPLVWFAGALSWVPSLVFQWAHMEDHAYLSAYWMLAIGLSLKAGQSGASVPELLRHHARHLTGLTFAAAAIWKITSLAFLDGRVFTQVLFFDYRFAWPFAEVFGGMSPEALSANREVAAQFRVPGASMDPAPLETASGMPLLVQFMILGTLLIEAGIAVTFLSPDGSILSRFRHVALLAFCWTTYPFVPVLGFALLLCTLGAVVAGTYEPATDPDMSKTRTASTPSRMQVIYAFSGLAFMFALVAPF